MKKSIFISMFALASFALATSCGSSQPAVQAPAQNQIPAGASEIVEGTAVIDYAEAEPVRRAYGEGTHFKEATARRMAEANARAQMASAINTCVKQAFSSYASAAALSSTDGVDSSYGEDQASKAEESILTVSKETVSGAVAVKTQRYRTANNQYKVYVCLEYKAEVAELAKEIAQKVNSQLSVEQRKELDFNEFKFNERVAAEFEAYENR